LLLRRCLHADRRQGALPEGMAGENAENATRCKRVRNQAPRGLRAATWQPGHQILLRQRLDRGGAWLAGRGWPAWARLEGVIADCSSILFAPRIRQIAVRWCASDTVVPSAAVLRPTVFRASIV